jgi:hypothetical protein
VEPTLTVSTSHTRDWQPCTRVASVLSSSGSPFTALPRSMR